MVLKQPHFARSGGPICRLNQTVEGADFWWLEEKRRELTRDLARHQHAEGAYMEVGSKLIELIAQAPQIFERADPGQRRELVGLLTSNRVLRGRTLEFELRKPFDALVTAANSENGWGGRIRTYVWRIQSPLPYHLATPQWLRFAPSIGSLCRI